MTTVSPFQVIIVVVFLASMIGLLFLIKRHREPLSRVLHAERRAHIISDLRLGLQERLQIIRIDASDYVVITGKGLQPIFYALPAAPAGLPSTQSLENVTAPTGSPTSDTLIARAQQFLGGRS